MSNESPEINLVLGGKPYAVKLTTGQIEIIEDAFDKPISQIDFERMKAVHLLSAFALQTEQRNRPFEDILADVRSQAPEWWGSPDEEPESEAPARKRPTKAATSG